MDSTDSSERSSSTIIAENALNIKEQLSDQSEEKIYEYFSLTAWNMQEIVESFEVLKEKLGLSKKTGLELYRGLKMTLGSPSSKVWKARDMMNLLEKRANQKEYMQQKAATGVRVFIIGAGPIGLRLAIDCMMLGAEVVVVEKRRYFSRNNVLHLWPFTIEDLRQLGAKKFYGKFCAGAIDHISIRSLQCILLKVALMIGVRFYSGIEFLEIQEPDPQIGWHARLNPSDHPLNLFEFDVLVGADGARKSRVPGFDRKELRGKLALAITANFRNYFTREEAAVQEISGVAFIFNQKFFKDLKEDTDIDLENIVYYKDDTHYFVMTAKKDSLLRKGVLMTDYSDTAQLLHRNNINMENLYEYSREAAGWCTDLPKLDFAHNHHHLNDVALFDFTSIHQAENAATAINRRGKDLYLCLVGDALLEPFWPTGTGCARGFLSAMDTAWLVKRIGQKKSVLDVLCEREGIFQRLPQTTPESLMSNIKSYTINPKSRYPNLHLHNHRPANVLDLYDTDETLPSPAALRHASIKVKRSAEAAGIDVPAEPAPSTAAGVKITVGGGGGAGGGKEADKENVVELPAEKKRKEEVKPLSVTTSPRRRSLKSRGSIHLAYYAEAEEDQTLNDPAVLLEWLKKQVKGHGVEVTDLTTSWSSGMALCALIYNFHPELIPDFKKLSPKNFIANNELAFSVAEERLGISRMLKPKEMKKPDKLALLSYLSQFYDFFLEAEPATSPSEEEEAEPMVVEEGGVSSTPKQNGGVTVEVTGASGERKDSTKKLKKKKSFFRRSSKKKLLTPSPSSAERSWNTKSVKRDGAPTSPPGTKLSAPLSTIQEKPTTPKLNRTTTPTTLGFKPPSTDSSDFCYFCDKRVYLMERMSANGVFFHRTCFKCSHCNCQLKIGGYSLSKGVGGEKGKFFCSAHYRQLFLSNPEAINYSRAGAGSKSEEGPGQVKARPEGGLAKVEEEKEVEEMETEVVTPEKGKKTKKSKKEKGRGKKETTPPSPAAPISPTTPASPTSPSSTDEEPVTPSSEDSEEKPKRHLGPLQRFRSWSMGTKRPKSKSSSRSRSSSSEPEEFKTSLEDDEHREVAQIKSGSTTPRSAPQSPAKQHMEVDPPVKLRSHTVMAARSQSQSGLVQRLSMGFEKLEANARETEIQLGAEGRERAKSQLFRQTSNPPQQPYQNTSTNTLTVIQEAATRGRGETTGSEAGIRAPRARSPARWRGSLQSSRTTQVEEVKGIQRGSRSILKRPQRGGRGQRSVSRPLIDNYETSDVAIQERRKQQRRFRDAQLIQREMSQLERQYDELEEVGRQIEQALRDAEETQQEESLMKSWLSLVNERNGLVRKTSELSLRMKELELEDRQYEIDKKLNALTSLRETFEMEGEELEDFEKKFEDMCMQKIKIVEERNELVEQTEEERMRELEEDNALMKKNESDSDEDFDIVDPDVNGEVPTRRGSAPARSRNKTKEEVVAKEQKRKSWWSFGRS